MKIKDTYIGENIDNAESIKLDASGFTGALSTSDTDVQTAIESLIAYLNAIITEA